MESIKKTFSVQEELLIEEMKNLLIGIELSERANPLDKERLYMMAGSRRDLEVEAKKRVNDYFKKCQRTG